MALTGIKHLIRQDVAIDLGTANSLIFLQGQGVVLSEPTVIVTDKRGRFVTLGAKAKEFLGKTPPDLRVQRPMRAGAVEDVEAVALYLRKLVEMARSRRPFFSSKVVICIPSRLTQLEKRAVLDAARDARFKKIFLLEEAMAAAIGAGVDVASPRPSMIVDIGGGTTEIAVISQMAYILSDSRRIGGDDIDNAISTHILREYGLKIGPNTAERLKWKLGAATHDQMERLAPVKVAGQNLRLQIPSFQEIFPEVIFTVLIKIVSEIAQIIEEALEKVLPETRRYLGTKGMLITGGCSLIRGLPEYLEHRLGMPVRRTPNPLETVVYGAGKTLSNFKYYKGVFAN